MINWILGLVVLVGAILVAVTAITGYSARDAIEAYRFRRNENDEDRRASDRIKIDDEGLRQRVVLEFYDSERLASGKLDAYCRLVDGRKLAHAFASKPEWLGLEIPLGTETVAVVHAGGSSTPTLDPALDRYANDLRRRFKTRRASLGPKTWNDPLYRLADLEIRGGHFDLSFGRTDFDAYIDEVGVIEEELNEALLRANLDPSQAVANRRKLLRYRDRVMPDGNALTDFGRRLTTGGICCLFAVARPAPDNDYCLLIGKRSEKVAGGQRMLSVTPQGFHGPISDREHDAKILRAVYRELLEELFKVSDVDVHGTIVSDDVIDEHHFVKWIHAHPDRVTLEVTGFGISLVTGDFCFLTILAIHDESLWPSVSKTIGLNWEYERFERKLSSKNREEIGDLLIKPNWVPEGRAALIEGLLRLKKIDVARGECRVDLPEIQDQCSSNL